MINLELLEKRKKLLNLKHIDIINKEFLYMLQEDSRNSLMIEGIFASKEELKKIISGNINYEKTGIDIINYFNTANFMYNMAIENYIMSEQLPLLSIITQIHKSLYETINSSIRGGTFRKGEIIINGAAIRPPKYDVDLWMQFYKKYVEYTFTHFNIVEATSRCHVLFESIHPFQDGNGRTGRILLNTLLLSKGYPNIIIKGIKDSERKKYISALEFSAIGIRDLFNENIVDISPETANYIISKGDFSKLNEIIYESLVLSMDRYICSQESEFINIQKLAAELNKSEISITQSILRYTLIAYKVNNKWQIPVNYINYLKTFK